MLTKPYLKLSVLVCRLLRTIMCPSSRLLVEVRLSEVEVLIPIFLSIVLTGIRHVWLLQRLTMLFPSVLPSLSVFLRAEAAVLVVSTMLEPLSELSSMGRLSIHHQESSLPDRTPTKLSDAFFDAMSPANECERRGRGESKRAEHRLTSFRPHFARPGLLLHLPWPNSRLVT